MQSNVGINKVTVDPGLAALGWRILEAGVSNELAASFRCIAEATARDGSLKYTHRVSVSLAKKIVCRSYGREILHLCHLVRAADAAGDGENHYEWLFFTLDRMTPAAFKGLIENAVSMRGWQRSGFNITSAGIVVHYPDGLVSVPFAQMPLLAGLLELMIETVSYAEVDGEFCELLAQPLRQESTKRAANAIRRILYDYLSNHLPSARQQEKFVRILGMLRTEGGVAVIDDHTVLDFWLKQSLPPNGRSNGFRLFRTVVRDFIRFIEVLQIANDRLDIEKAGPVDEDGDSRLFDPMQLEELFDTSNCWHSPLTSLDDGPAGEIKFLTKRERENLSLLLDGGPTAVRLPLSVIRSEVFGRCQARIVEALRANKTQEELLVLLSCATAQPYEGLVSEYTKRREHIQRVVMAAAYVTVFHNGISKTGMSSEQVPGGTLNSVTPLKSAPETKRAFDDIRRKGFDPAGLDDPGVIDGFRTAADALCVIADQIDTYLTRLEDVNRQGHGLTGWFETDRATFRDQFTRIYGEHIDERAICNSHRETIGSGEAAL